MARASALGRAWLRSGLAELTGRADGPPLLAPDPLVERIEVLGRQAGVDALSLASERARLGDLHAGGSTSCDGTTRLVPTADGWVAVRLAEPDDVAAVPAWLEVDPGSMDSDDPWTTVAATLATRPTTAAAARAVLVSLPVCALGEHERLGPGPAVAIQLGGLSPMRRRSPEVLDLSTRWAGPLCGSILADAGANVTKVEDTARRRATQPGDPALRSLLDAAKDQRVLDLDDEHGLADLRALVARADVVVESSGPGALGRLGIDALAALRAEEGPRIWVSVTGHGRDAARVGFGDDAGVSGGLVAWDEQGPCFVADALAEPLAGITAAGVVRTALQAGGRWLVDVGLAGVAAHVAHGLDDRPWRAAP